MWNNLRSAFEIGGRHPRGRPRRRRRRHPRRDQRRAAVLQRLGPRPEQDAADGVAVAKVAPLAGDPAPLSGRCTRPAWHGPRPPTGSTVQLAAFQGAIASCDTAEEVSSWLAGDVPEGIHARPQPALAVARAAGRPGRHGPRGARPSSWPRSPPPRRRVDHARAVASLPDDEAKAWAWGRFTGAEDVPNYELQATGQGMWVPGQEHLTTPYVERFFADLPSTPSHRSGWVLADAACWFFPLTSQDPTPSAWPAASPATSRSTCRCAASCA